MSRRKQHKKQHVASTGIAHVPSKLDAQVLDPATDSAINPAVKPTTVNTPTKQTATPKDSARINPRTAKFDLVEEWDRYWGNGDFADWQRLCRDLGISGKLKSKDKCKEVNIHDFLRADDKLCVTHFATERDLIQYTVASKKRYPRHKIEKDSPLKLLMANIKFDAWRKDEARHLRNKENVKNMPRKYQFVPPPENYGRYDRAKAIRSMDTLTVL